MDNFSLKAISFGSRILTHYPKSCERQTHEPLQPYSHMHDHRKQRQIYEKSTEQKLQNMLYFKNLGNQKFKQKKFDEALYFYQKVIIYGDYTFPQNKIHVYQMELLIGQANINSAICQIKIKEWAKSEVHIRETIKVGLRQFQDVNIENYSENQKSKINNIKQSKLNILKKGYYWQCKYYINKIDYKSAEKSIKKLLQLDQKISSKEEAAQLSKQIQKQKQNHQKQSQKLSQKMFSSQNKPVMCSN